ncbi:protein LURP-one-related 15-like [Zingiber officinale]|uniref:protein LURP-one-related 15-like n=1 Tax=Zingiber officinale TaxID=94328 RepID=UPI001C4C8F57|nr:protein LURP-one-related 15-like [Zingiber officinale]
MHTASEKMFATTSSSMENLAPVVAVGEQFCVPHVVDLTITGKAFRDHLTVTDTSGDVVFTVETVVSLFSHKLLLLDAAGHTLLTIKAKGITWKVYRGESKDEKDLLFKVKSKIHLININMELDVTMPINNNFNDGCDYKMKAKGLSSSPGNIYIGESNSIIAQSIRANKLFGCKIQARVNPNVDYAFIVALIVISEDYYSGS